MLPAKQQTKVSTSKVIMLKESIPETLFEEYNQAQRQLKKAQQMVSDTLLSSALLHDINPTAWDWIQKDGAYAVEVKYNVTIEGKFVEQKSEKAPLHLDPKTINTLLNGKILKEAEKRRLIERLGLTGVLNAPEEDKPVF
jgi:hypothetical protein